MVSIPVRIREKYGIREGSKLEFVESDEGLLLVPVRSLAEFEARSWIVRSLSERAYVSWNVSIGRKQEAEAGPCN